MISCKEVMRVISEIRISVFRINKKQCAQNIEYQYLATSLIIVRKVADIFSSALIAATPQPPQEEQEEQLLSPPLYAPTTVIALSPPTNYRCHFRCYHHLSSTII